MKQFTSHIDYLLQKHDCVIIPEFGGFVLSREEAFVIPDGAIRPPFVVVGFNPDLKYNDGLLAESYMNVYNISYDAACKKIKENVSRLNEGLSSGQSMQIGRLGRVKLDDNKQLCFTPNNYLSLYYPETYGLSLARVRPLAEIVDPNISLNKPAKNKISFKNIVTGSAAAAAAVLIFFVSSTPIDQNDRGKQQIQQSSFFPNVNINSLIPSLKSSRLNDLNEQKSTNLDTVQLSLSFVSERLLNKDQIADAKMKEKSELAVDDNLKQSNQNADPLYYIIIGSANSKIEADRALAKLKSQGHTSSKIMTLGKDRYRIYVSSFAKKESAISYLVNFKKQNPKQSDAWLYSKKI